MIFAKVSWNFEEKKKKNGIRESTKLSILVFTTYIQERKILRQVYLNMLRRISICLKDKPLAWWAD